MTAPTTAELIALLEHADRTMTPGEMYRIGNCYLTSRGSFPCDIWVSVQGLNKEANTAGIATLRNNAAAIARELARLSERAEKAEAERDELLASHQKVVGEHNGLVLSGDSLLAAAGRYRVERDAALAKCRELETASTAVLEWYDRDGSVGGACDPMEKLREVLTK